MTVTSSSIGYVTKVVETFDTETENSIELQEVGWQAILDNFKGYVKGKLIYELNRKRQSVPLASVYPA